LKKQKIKFNSKGVKRVDQVNPNPLPVNKEDGKISLHGEQGHYFIFKRKPEIKPPIKNKP